MWEVGNHHPTAGARSAAWQEEKRALFCCQFLLFLNKKVKNPVSSGTCRITVCDCQVVVSQCNLGRSSVRQGTLEQPFVAQLF